MKFLNTYNVLAVAHSDTRNPTPKAIAKGNLPTYYLLEDDLVVHVTSDHPESEGTFGRLVRHMFNDDEMLFPGYKQFINNSHWHPVD